VLLAFLCSRVSLSLFVHTGRPSHQAGVSECGEMGSRMGFTIPYLVTASQSLTACLIAGSAVVVSDDTQ